MAKELDLQMAVETKPEALDTVLNGLLVGTVGGIIAPGSTGKSMLALEIAALVGTRGAYNPLGLELPLKSKCWQRTGRGIMYVTAEDPVEILHRRIHYIGRGMSPGARQVFYANARVLSLYGHSLPPYLINGKEKDERWIDWLRGNCKQNNLVIIDTLTLFHNSNENDSGEMKFLIDILKEVAFNTQCAIVFLHHANKNSMLTGSGDEQSASRGSSVLTDNIRWQLNMTCMSKEEAKEYNVDNGGRKQFVKITGAKMNYGVLGEGVWLRRNLELEGVLEAVNMEARKRNKDKESGGWGNE